MRVSEDKIRGGLRDHGWTLRRLFAESGVSPTAYYHIVRRPEILPKTLIRIARVLGLSPSALIEDVPDAVAAATRVSRQADRIARRHPEIDIGDIRQTLIQLGEPPAVRLRRSLSRGRQLHPEP